jgi:peptide/nickel transport system substrate-binding protein
VEDLQKQKLSRRRFLRVSAITAASTALVACGAEGPPQGGGAAATTAPAGGEATAAPAAANTAIPTLAPATAVPTIAASAAKEPPALASMVEAGTLPPVAERLPKNPLVIAHKWIQPGKYGGIMQLNARGTWELGGYIQESMYGHSHLRWLNDGLEIGPGLAERWESNEDASEWTFYFREGLKWSDGEPWTTKDIQFWWEDMVLDEQQAEGPPDEARSGKGTLMQLEIVDDYTIKMVFDAPAPLTADRLAMWVKRGIGPHWMAPRHYMEQFHPKYNSEMPDFKLFDEKVLFKDNPECPTMTGWKLTTHEVGVRGVWERNPYYWCVDTQGNQLPYIDGLNVTSIADKEIQKLAFLDGKVDYAHFHSLTLSDISALKGAEATSKLQVRFWDSGSGTGSIFFFNQDYKDEKYRTLIRDPKFRKALSHAYNRAEVQKVVYFNTGELTTGTMSPKAIEYQFSDEAKTRYAEFRDAAIKYDPEMAKTMFEELGLKVGSNGFRTFPDGSELKVRLEFQADAGPETITKNEILQKSWQAVGIDAVLNPVPPQGFKEQYAAGEIMSHTNWEVGDGPNHLVFPQWMVPLEAERWAPMQGNWYSVRGTEKEGTELDKDPYERTPPRMEPEKGGPIEQIWAIYDQSKVEPDAMKRHGMVWELMKIHIDSGPFFMGVVANYPRIILVSTDLRNVPQKEELATGGFVNPWIIPFPAVLDPESWYFDNPEAHA